MRSHNIFPPDFTLKIKEKGLVSGFSMIRKIDFQKVTLFFRKIILNVLRTRKKNFFFSKISFKGPEMEFKEFEPRFKSAKTRFKILKHLIQF